MEGAGASGGFWQLSGDLCRSPVTTSSVHCTGSDTGMSLGESEAEPSFLGIPGVFFPFPLLPFPTGLGEPLGWQSSPVPSGVWASRGRTLRTSREGWRSSLRSLGHPCVPKLQVHPRKGFGLNPGRTQVERREPQGWEDAVSQHSFVRTNPSWSQNSRFRVGKMVPDPHGSDVSVWGGEESTERGNPWKTRGFLGVFWDPPSPVPPSPGDALRARSVPGSDPQKPRGAQGTFLLGAPSRYQGNFLRAPG